MSAPLQTTVPRTEHQDPKGDRPTLKENRSNRTDSHPIPRLDDLCASGPASIRRRSLLTMRRRSAPRALASADLSMGDAAAQTGGIRPAAAVRPTLATTRRQHATPSPLSLCSVAPPLRLVVRHARPRCPQLSERNRVVTSFTQERATLSSLTLLGAPSSTLCRTHRPRITLCTHRHLHSTPHQFRGNRSESHTAASTHSGHSQQ